MPDAVQPLTLEQLQVQRAAIDAQIAILADDEAVPVLPLDEARDRLSAAEQALEFAERPFWDVEHAQIDLNKANLDVDDFRRKAAAEEDNDLAAGYSGKADKIAATIPDLEKALAEKQAIQMAHPIDKAAIDIAAEAVIVGRKIVEKAEAAAKDA